MYLENVSKCLQVKMRYNNRWLLYINCRGYFVSLSVYTRQYHSEDALRITHETHDLLFYPSLLIDEQQRQ